MPAPVLTPCAERGPFTSDLAGFSLVSRVVRVPQLLGPSLPCPALPPQKFDELLQLASRGRHANVDMLVQDIYGGAHQTLGLSGNLIASSFGKSATADRGTCQDLPFMVTKAWPASVPRASLCPLVWRDCPCWASRAHALHILLWLIRMLPDNFLSLCFQGRAS